MPDQYGNPTEAELRGQAPAGYVAPAAGPAPQLAFQGNIGGNNVQMYGPSPLSAEQATAYMANQGAAQADNGSMSKAMYAALYPEGDQKAYAKLNQTFKDSTSMKGVGSKLTNAVKFELERGLNLVKNVAKDPSRLLTGVDPIATKVSNKAFGLHNQALVGQLGGATSQDFKDYEAKHGFGSLGAAKELSTSANYIAGMMGAAGAAHGIGNLFRGLGGSAPTTAPSAAPGGDMASDFAHLNMANVGGGNAGALAQSGGITGGAGTGLWGSIGGSGILSSGSIANAARLSSLVSNVQSALGALNPPKAPGGAAPAVAGNTSNPFAALPGVSGTYNDSNGQPLSAMSFPQSGFRDANAFQYLMQTLGLPSPQAQQAPPSYSLPQNLESFSGMDFGSMFGDLLKPSGDGRRSSPKTSPTAVNDGTRGPNADMASGLSSFSGPLGNGGGYLSPRDSFTTLIGRALR